MKPSNAFQTLSQAPTRQPLPSLVHNVDIVVGFSPIITNKDHPIPFRINLP
jgi:hypothetical protein